MKLAASRYSMSGLPNAKRMRTIDCSSEVAFCSQTNGREDINLDDHNIRARIHQATDELLRREVIARLGLHSYLTSSTNPPPCRPPQQTLDPAMAFLQALIEKSRQPQSHMLMQQAAPSPVVLAALLQAQMQPLHQSGSYRLNPLTEVVASSPQARTVSSTAIQALHMNRNNCHIGHALFPENRESTVPGLTSAFTSFSSIHVPESHSPIMTSNYPTDPATLAAVASLVASLRTQLETGSAIATKPEQQCQSPVSMVSDSDGETLSEYQCLLREQMDLFEASIDDVKVTAQGRNKPIFLKQVGIQCKHCAHLPPKQRPRGAVYFPARLSRIYQSAQNMGVNHFNGRCPNIPESISETLDQLKSKKSLFHGGGKKYWADKAVAAGIVEVENGLVFASNQT